jgi:hypothetical protein
MRLSDDLRKWRADRPDEWTMDRFIQESTRLEAEVEKFTSTNSSSTKLADDIECAKQWLLPQRPVTQVEVDACIGELDIIVSQLRAG